MNAIVCVDQNWAIGRGGDLLFRISADLKRFKALTTGHPILLGRKTLETFPGGRPLPGRANLILSRNPHYRVEGAAVFPGVEALLAQAPGDAFVVGGETVYRQLLPHCDRVYVTKVEAACPEADAWFPDLDEEEAWRVVEESEPLEERGLAFRYMTYQRV